MQRSSCIALIDCGADVNRQDSSGLTALHVACYHGNREATNVLLSIRADVDIRDKMVCARILINEPNCSFILGVLFSSIVRRGIVPYTGAQYLLITAVCSS